VKALADVYAASRPPAFRAWARIVILLLVILLGWSFYAKFDEVAVADGEVVPQGQIKTIQHLEGGIIKDIFVREGDRVKTGTPLVQLDLMSTSASREELSVRLDGNLLVAARLKAQARGTKPVYDKDVAGRRPRLLDLERERYEAYHQEVSSTLAVIKERVHQHELEVRQIKTKQKIVSNDLDLAREEFAMSTQLLKDGLTSKLDHLKLERETEMLEGELTELAVTLPRAKAGVAEAREQMNNQAIKFRRLSGEELGKVELDIAYLKEALAKAREEGLDLVELSPTAKPPVCRILDFGKYLYTLEKSEKASKKRHHMMQLKEVKFGPKIEEHDYQTKLRNAIKFLERGDMVKLTLMFRGREMKYTELGKRILERFVEDVSDVAEVEKNSGLERNLIVVHLQPKAAVKRKVKKAATNA